MPNHIVQFNEEIIKGQIRERVRGSVEDITETLWGSKGSASTISDLNKKAYSHIEIWRNRSLQGGKYLSVYVDGLCLKRNWGGASICILGQNMVH